MTPEFKRRWLEYLARPARSLPTQLTLLQMMVRAHNALRRGP